MSLRIFLFFLSFSIFGNIPRALVYPERQFTNQFFQKIIIKDILKRPSEIKFGNREVGFWKVDDFNYKENILSFDLLPLSYKHEFEIFIDGKKRLVQKFKNPFPEIHQYIKLQQNGQVPGFHHISFWNSEKQIIYLILNSESEIIWGYVTDHKDARWPHDRLKFFGKRSFWLLNIKNKLVQNFKFNGDLIREFRIPDGYQFHHDFTKLNDKLYFISREEFYKSLSYFSYNSVIDNIKKFFFIPKIEVELLALLELDLGNKSFSPIYRAKKHLKTTGFKNVFDHYDHKISGDNFENLNKNYLNMKSINKSRHPLSLDYTHSNSVSTYQDKIIVNSRSNNHIVIIDSSSNNILKDIGHLNTMDIQFTDKDFKLSHSTRLRSDDSLFLMDNESGAFPKIRKINLKSKIVETIFEEREAYTKVRGEFYFNKDNISGFFPERRESDTPFAYIRNINLNNKQQEGFIKIIHPRIIPIYFFSKEFIYEKI